MKTTIILFMMLCVLGAKAQQEIKIISNSIVTDTAGVKTSFCTIYTKTVDVQTNAFTLDKVNAIIQTCVDDSISCSEEVNGLKQARTALLGNDQISESGKVNKMAILKSQYQKIQKLLGTIVNRKNEYEKVRGVLE
jgi:hypothetical protein